MSLPLEAKLRTLLELDAILIASGAEELYPSHPMAEFMPPEGECIMFDMLRDLNEALRAIQRKDWTSAAEILTNWDRLLQERHGTHLWFEVRLRLIALKMFGGEKRHAERLADQLQERASSANDWLTFVDSLRFRTAICLHRRLHRMRARSQKRRPLAMGQLSLIYSSNESDSDDDEQPATPYREKLLEIGALFEQVTEAELESTLARIRNEIRSIDVATVQHDTDACA